MEGAATTLPLAAVPATLLLVENATVATPAASPTKEAMAEVVDMVVDTAEVTDTSPLLVVHALPSRRVNATAVLPAASLTATLVSVVEEEGFPPPLAFASLSRKASAIVVIAAATVTEMPPLVPISPLSLALPENNAFASPSKRVSAIVDLLAAFLTAMVDPVAIHLLLLVLVVLASNSNEASAVVATNAASPTS